MKLEKKQARLDMLEKKHRQLDKEIQEHERHYRNVGDLKSQKLQMKQEIYALKRELAL